MSKYKTIILSLIILFYSLEGLSQENKSIEKYKDYIEASIGIGFERSNTKKNTTFEFANTQFEFNKNEFLPFLNFSFLYNKYIANDNLTKLFYVKSGIILSSNQLNTTNNYKYSEHTMNIPVLFSLDFLINKSNSNNLNKHFFNISSGPNFSSPIYKKLDLEDNADNKGKVIVFDNLKIGVLGEFAYKFQNKYNRIHKIGLRFEQDLTDVNIWNSSYNIQPLYSKYSVFYSINLN